MYIHEKAHSYHITFILNSVAVELIYKVITTFITFQNRVKIVNHINNDVGPSSLNLISVIYYPFCIIVGSYKTYYSYRFSFDYDFELLGVIELGT